VQHVLNESRNNLNIFYYLAFPYQQLSNNKVSDERAPQFYFLKKVAQAGYQTQFYF
jgi:hypothetical protein